MLRAVAFLLALIGGVGVVVTMGAFILSSVCLDYCEDEPSAGDAFQFALPFGLVAFAFLAAAANLFMPGRGSWPRALGLALGSMVLGGLLTWAAAAAYDALDGGVVGWLVLVGLAGVWLGATAGAAMRS